tara:strand:- start:1545 stop:1760 length:216 start_codon:yes stop_codon:yes gene_type:complete
MTEIQVSDKQLSTLKKHVEGVARVIGEMTSQDQIAKKRMNEIDADPSIGKSEKELNAYLKKRGVKLDPMDS